MASRPKRDLVTLRLPSWGTSKGCSQNGMVSKVAAEASFDARSDYNLCFFVSLDDFNERFMYK
jgi:hypothetical protein